ncbi:MAG: hypothetical protein KAR44_02220 [Candidatus Aegiribacteria sp.]|nr:hypothetical protein [Candidatus Aegiribacteria sp.]
MILLRKLHRYTGITIAPLVLVQVVTGFLLQMDSLNRNARLLHNWSQVSKFVAFALAIGLAFMVVTGSIIFIQMWLQRRKRAARKRRAVMTSNPSSREDTE